jgi:hypothetical protein
MIIRDERAAQAVLNALTEWFDNASTNDPDYDFVEEFLEDNGVDVYRPRPTTVSRRTQ